MRRLTVFAAVLAFVLAELPAASAAPTSGSVQFQPPGEAQGNLTTSLAAMSFVAGYGRLNHTEVSLKVASNDLHLERVDYTDDSVAMGGVLQPVPNSARTSTTPIRGGAGTLNFSQVRSDYSLIVQTEGPAKVAA